MALTLQFKAPSGLTCDSAYVKVERVIVSKSGAVADVGFYAEPGTLPPFHVETRGFVVNLDGPNPIKQAYLYLKSLPEFSDAVDC